MPQRVDDLNVADHEDLLRRIWNQEPWINLKLLKDGTLRPSSVAFLDEINEVSVHRAVQKTPQEALQGFPDFGLVAIQAAVPRSVGLIVAETPEDPDPSHRAICEPPNVQLATSRKARARKMAEEARWIVEPLRFRQTPGTT